MHEKSIINECGVCNGWGKTERNCSKCEGNMNDQGRVTDFLDDYSPYLDQRWTDLVDGDLDSSVTGDCVHLFICEACGFNDIQI